MLILLKKKRSVEEIHVLQEEINMFQKEKLKRHHMNGAYFEHYANNFCTMAWRVIFLELNLCVDLYKMSCYPLFIKKPQYFQKGINSIWLIFGIEKSLCLVVFTYTLCANAHFSGNSSPYYSKRWVLIFIVKEAMECLQEGAHDISISTPNMILFW